MPRKSECSFCKRKLTDTWIKVVHRTPSPNGGILLSTSWRFCSSECLTKFCAAEEAAVAKKVEPLEVDELPDGEVEDCFTDEEGVKRDCDVGNYRECKRCTRKIVST